MEKSFTSLDIMTIDELTEYIINTMDMRIQLEIVGDEYYNSFINFTRKKRKEIILSSLKQMPEDVIENIIKREK